MSNFESFSDDSIPRYAPRPSISVAETTITPTVPEVSLILDKQKIEIADIPTSATSLPYRTYSSWKREQTIKSPTLSNSSYSKKHVHFVPTSSFSPSQQQQINFGISNCIPPSSTYDNIRLTSYTPQISATLPSSTTIGHNYYQSQQIMNTPRNSTGTFSSEPKLCTYVGGDSGKVQEPIQFMQIVDSGRNQMLPNSVLQNLPNVNHNNVFENSNQLIFGKNEFNQLFDMVQRQTDQLQLLQQQVQILLSERQNVKNVDISVQQEQQQTDGKQKVAAKTTEDKGIQCCADNEPELSIEHKKKVSIGVMTNFNLDKINESETKSPKQKDGFRSNQIPMVQDEYNSDNKENLGVRFYGNVLGQMHQILDKTSPCHKCKCHNNASIIQFATGTAANAMNISDRDAFHHVHANANTSIAAGGVAIESPYLQILPQPSTERSLAMNALALKYLPDEKLNELVVPRSRKIPNQSAGILTRPPNDMSFATMRYMNKYGLINSLENNYEYVNNNQNYNYNEEQYDHLGENKFLDVTAIKRQPKLL